MKVAVAISGGVDSSVAAALLVEAGHDVTGINLKLLPDRQDRSKEEDRSARDAESVCASLRIPFVRLDMAEEFDRLVVRHFCDVYASGKTPNPCIVCNARIKFGYLLEYAVASGFEALATGHYARVEHHEEKGDVVLRRSVDREKDQSYFLCALTREQLKRVVFPLGPLTKQQVRAKALELGLQVHDKDQSQDVCFVKPDGLEQFLKTRIPESLAPGPIEDSDGRELGRHDGWARYTIGQRKGLGVAAREPLYVRRLIPERAAVVLGPRSSVLSKRVVVSGINWIAWEKPPAEFKAEVQIRHGQSAAEAVVHAGAPSQEGAEASVEFAEPQFAPTPGQAAVFYRGDVVLGGGTITR